LAKSGEITDPCPVPLSLLEPFLDHPDDAPVADPMFQEANQPFLADFVGWSLGRWNRERQGGRLTPRHQGDRADVVGISRDGA
jgi:hypothetical protein